MLDFLIDYNPGPRRNHGTIFNETSFKKRLTSADSGLQLDLVIALSGFPAEVQPHELFSSAKMRWNVG
jgi:hypothetical protein